MHFGEYELSPSLISLSPLPSVHWNTFQRIPIRTSSWCYPTFILTKVDHLVSRLLTPTIHAPIKTRFRFGSGPEALNLAGESNS